MSDEDNRSKQDSHLRKCDIVMKGGITSGVVYPGAVSEIAKDFNLRGIGGTSAGAIAAAAAAAAQYGRLTGHDDSFQKFSELGLFLGRTNNSGQTNLFTFFQPQRATKKIFYALAGALEAKSILCGAIGVLRTTAARFPGIAILGMAPGCILVALALTNRAGLLSLWSVAMGIATILTGSVIALGVYFFLRFGNAVPRNFFGLCSGMSTDPGMDCISSSSADGQALTVWLTKYLNELAGLDSDGPPLTFGMLWWPHSPSDSNHPSTEPSILLEMYSTCLSKGRPFRLPFQDDDNVRENVWYFSNDDFRRLFPPSVLTWLKNHPRKHGGHPKLDLNQYTPMPEPWNLPVVVAARMSLSFPILLSAVPLFAYEYDVNTPIEAHAGEPDTSVAEHRTQRDVLSRFWFSDGGICSNFPIHFFDAPLPRWPTFAINLVGAPEGTSQADLAKPWMPANNHEGIREPFTEFDTRGGIKSVAGFLSAIINTMQNWSDNTLSRMPGFRDRIAHVGLTSQEGGLNLQMPNARIAALNERGVNAGIEFVERFGTEQKAPMNWSNHRWVRLRTMLSSVGEIMRAVDHGCEDPEPGDQNYEDWVRSTPVGSAPSYQWKNNEQRELALETIRRFRASAKIWMTQNLDATTGAPRPRPELRPRPRT